MKQLQPYKKASHKDFNITTNKESSLREKCPGVILVRTLNLSVFGPNAGKYGPE